jgi:hypothetical protein
MLNLCYAGAADTSAMRRTHTAAFARHNRSSEAVPARGSFSSPCSRVAGRISSARLSDDTLKLQA